MNRQGHSQKRRTVIQTWLSALIASALLLSNAQAVFAEDSSVSGTSSEAVSESESALSQQESAAEEAKESSAESAASESKTTESETASSAPSAAPSPTPASEEAVTSKTPAENSGQSAAEAAADVNADSKKAANAADEAEAPDTATDILDFGFTEKISGKDRTDETFTVEVYKTDDKYAASGEPVITKTTDGTLTAAEASYFVTNAVSYPEQSAAASGMVPSATLYYVVKEKEQSATSEGWTSKTDTAEYHFKVTVEPVKVNSEAGQENTETRYRITSIKEENKKIDELNLNISQGTGSDDSGSLIIENKDLKLTQTEKEAVDYRVYTASNENGLYGLLSKTTGKLNKNLPDQDKTEGTWVPADNGSNTTPAESGNDATYSYKVTVDTKNENVKYAVLVRASKSGDNWVNGDYPIAIFELASKSSDGEAASTDSAASVLLWKLTVPQVAFTNTYSYAASGRKTETFTLTNRVSDGAPSETFTFTMKHNKDVQTATVTGSGTASFTKTFSKPGTYTYEVAETKGSTLGWTYDTSKYYIVYTVTDDGAGGFTFDKKVYKNAKSGTNLGDNGVVFDNVYVSGSYSFTAVDSDDSETAVSGAHFKLYGIREEYSTDSSSAYAKAAKRLKNGTVRKKDLTELATVKSGESGTVKLTDLVAGTSYVVEESKAASGYQKSKGAVVLTTSNSSGNLSVRAVNSDEEIFAPKTKVWAQHPTKVDITMKSSTGAALTNAKLQLKDTKTGKTVDTWKSSASAHEVTHLVAGREYEITQTNKLVGYTKAETVTFKVTAQDVTTEDYIQNVTVTSTKNATASGSSGKGSGSGSGSGTGNGSKTSGTSAAKTGDRSPIVPLILAMCAALVLIIGLVMRKEKK